MSPYRTAGQGDFRACGPAKAGCNTRPGRGHYCALKGAEEFVEFIGGVKIGFEFAGGEALAKIVEAACEKIESGGEDFLIGEDDVAPSGIRAAGKAERIAQAGTGEGNRQTVFIETVVEERSERDGSKLREMRGETNGVVVLHFAEPERARADFFENFHEGGDARFVLCGRGADERVGIAAEEIGVGMGDAGEFPAGHGMAAEKKRAALAGEEARGGLRDADFGAAGVGDERVRRSM